MDQNLVNYIQECRKHGISDEQIKKQLLSAGWQEALVNQGLASVPRVAPASAVPAAFVSPSQNTQSAQKPTEEKPLKKQRSPAAKLALTAVIVAVLAAAGYYVYQVYGYYSPQKTIKNFLAGSVLLPTKPVHFDSVLTISGAYNSQILTAKINSSGDLDNSLAAPPLKTLSGASVSYAGFNYSVSGIEFRFINGVIYANVSNIPFVQNLIDPKHGGWVKIDLNSLPSSQKNAVPSQNFSAAQFFKFLNDNNLISGFNYIAKETVDSAASYHYAIQIDKNQLKNFVNKNLGQIKQQNLLASLQGLIQSGLTGDDQHLTDYLIDQSTFAKTDIWLDARESTLRKLDFEIQIPSQKKSAQVGTSQQDQTTVSDISQLRVYLEIYKNLNGGYPSSLQQLVTSKVAASIPSAAADPNGACGLSKNNNYAYSTSGTAKKSTKDKTVSVYPQYSLNFCLDNAVGPYKPGLHSANLSGISDLPSNIDFSPKPVDPSQNFDTKNKTTVEFNLDVSDLSKAPDVSAPADAYDLVKSAQNGIGQSLNKAK